jgi:putative tryptophan/tyrosine transport system substrate-binding protein
MLAAPLGADAQPAGKDCSCQSLTSNTIASSEPSVATFRQRLRELGWIEGQNLVLDLRYANDRYERLSGLSAEPLALKLDVIVAFAAPERWRAGEATPGATSPRH